MELNKIYHGDCLDVLAREFPDKSVDFTITSPPFKTYYTEYERDSNRYYSWLDSVLNELKRVTREYILMFNSSIRLVDICKRTNPDRVLIWYKGVMKYSYRYEPIFVYSTDTSSFKINKRIWSDTFKFQPIYNWLSPYQNPVKLYSSIVRMVTREGDIVLDPFMGSGTLAIACLLNNRRWVGIEIDESNIEKAKAIITKYYNQSLIGYASKS